jgi:hypothetical protein
MNAEALLKRPAGKLANLAQNVAWVWRTLPVPGFKKKTIRTQTH